MQIKNLRDAVRYKRVPSDIALLQLQGFFGKRSVTVKEHKIARKAILRLSGYDPYGLINDTCFAYRPDQQCVSTAVGSSRARCKAHDIMNAMICAIGGYEVFNYGYPDDVGYTGAAPKDIRYWSLLMSCYWNDEIQVREKLQELMADESFELKVASTFCDCFMIATRRNYPSLINVLHEEARDREDVHEKLGKRPSEFNVLIESIRMGLTEVFENLLKWKWKFVHDSWSYLRYVKHILDYEKIEENTRQTLLRMMLTWTEQWRNISEMKSLLQHMGKNNSKRMLEIFVESLKSQHFFRHERGADGDFTPAEPLLDFCRSDSHIEMLRLFLNNRKLLLPHTTEQQDMEMRRLCINRELDYSASILKSSARLDVLELLVDHSQDLVDEKSKLQVILCEIPMGREDKLKEWGWLAKKVGLKTKCSKESGHDGIQLGSVLLAKAAEKLDVEVVRFLTDNGCMLAREAKTFQVYENDEVTMDQLETVRELLARGGQGEYKERRVLETTFMPFRTSKAKKALSLVKAKAEKAEPAIDATTAAYSPTYPNFFRRMSQAAQKKSHKKRSSQSSVSVSGSMHNGSSPSPSPA